MGKLTLAEVEDVTYNVKTLFSSSLRLSDADIDALWGQRFTHEQVAAKLTELIERYHGC